MEDRSALTASCQGEELQSRLADLKERYFGKQAATIRAEESSGFFRFQRPRCYGSN